MKDGTIILRIEGSVTEERGWTFADLEKVPRELRIEDVAKLEPGISGTGVRVKALLLEAKPASRADYATFHSQDGKFAASLPLPELMEKGILVYKRDGAPLPPGKGGPIRLVVPQGEDACANVKSVARIEITVGKGKDTTVDPDHDNPAIHGHSHGPGQHGHDHGHGHPHEHPGAGSLQHTHDQDDHGPGHHH